jgi:hypothetical protein
MKTREEKIQDIKQSISSMDTDKIAELFQRHIEGREQLLEQHSKDNEKLADLCVSYERQIAQLEQSLNDLRNIQAQESDAQSKRIEEIERSARVHERRLDKYGASILKLEDLEEEHETQRIEHIDITQSHEDRLAKLEPCRHNKNVSLIHTCHTNPSSMAVIYHCNECGNDFDANGNEAKLTEETQAEFAQNYVTLRKAIITDLHEFIIDDDIAEIDIYLDAIKQCVKQQPIKPDYADLLVHMTHILTSVQRIENGSQTYSNFFFDEIKETLEQAKPIVAEFDIPEPETLAVWHCKECDEEYSGEVQRCGLCGKAICDDCYRKDAGKIICDSCWGDSPQTRKIVAQCVCCLEKFTLIIHAPLNTIQCYKCGGEFQELEEVAR